MLKRMSLNLLGGGRGGSPTSNSSSAETTNELVSVMVFDSWYDHPLSVEVTRGPDQIKPGKKKPSPSYETTISLKPSPHFLTKVPPTPFVECLIHIEDCMPSYKRKVLA